MKRSDLTNQGSFCGQSSDSADNMRTDQPAPDFGEPWSREPDSYSIRNRDGDLVSQDARCTGEAKRDRLITCVNACLGMADPAAEIQAMREAIQSATSALEDWQLLWHEIRGQQSSRAHQDGASVNTTTAAALAKLQPFIKP